MDVLLVLGLAVLVLALAADDGTGGWCWCWQLGMIWTAGRRVALVLMPRVLVLVDGNGTNGWEMRQC